VPLTDHVCWPGEGKEKTENCVSRRGVQIAGWSRNPFPDHTGVQWSGWIGGQLALADWVSISLPIKNCLALRADINLR